MIVCFFLSSTRNGEIKLYIAYAGRAVENFDQTSIQTGLGLVGLGLGLN